LQLCRSHHEQRDREIANPTAFRKSLYDYDIERVAMACLHEGWHAHKHHSIRLVLPLAKSSDARYQG
jgi:hypothetical protein